MEIWGRGYTKVLLLLLDGKRHAYNVGMSERFLFITFPLLFIASRIHDRMVLFFYDRFLFVNRVATQGWVCVQVPSDIGSNMKHILHYDF